MTNGIIRIALFTAFLVSTVFLAQYISAVTIFHEHIYLILVFYGFIGVLLHSVFYLAEQKLLMDKTLLLLAGVTLRLLIAIFAMIVVALSGVSDKALFIINFAVIYLFYLVFEITSVLSNLRTNLK